jgi:histone acetyltransferase MYST1
MTCTSSADPSLSEKSSCRSIAKKHPFGIPRPPTTARIIFGGHSIDCWYFSPYPPSLSNSTTLFVCDFCAMPFGSKDCYIGHDHGLGGRSPPGREIYSNGPLVVFEVSPRDSNHFCRCLVLLGQLFTETFSENCFISMRYSHFYVLCLTDESGAHIIGYFSRITEWRDPTIISRVVVLPPFQRQGFGTLMIAIAYEIARREGITGGPAHPLGDLGQIAFSAFWAAAVCAALAEHGNEIESASDIADLTGIAIDDVRETLADLGLAPGDPSPDTIREFVRAGRVKRMRIPFKSKLLEWDRQS